jgi:hypothetical protein
MCEFALGTFTLQQPAARIRRLLNEELHEQHD